MCYKSILLSSIILKLSVHPTFRQTKTVILAHLYKCTNAHTHMYRISLIKDQKNEQFSLSWTDTKTKCLKCIPLIYEKRKATLLRHPLAHNLVKLSPSWRKKQDIETQLLMVIQVTAFQKACLTQKIYFERVNYLNIHYMTRDLTDQKGLGSLQAIR